MRGLEGSAKEQLKRQLTPEQRRKALKCRFSITQKRQTPEELAAGTPGRTKARLVAQDLKKFNPRDPIDTHADAPSLERWFCDWAARVGI